MTRYLLSIDVEDWFHAHNLKPIINRSDWGECEWRVHRSTSRVLSLLASHNTTATFFILGWVADRFPDLIRSIDEAGHEVCTHGYAHQPCYELTDGALRQDIERSLNVLKPLVGQVKGYRAPSFSISDRVVRILDNIGLRYDSSLLESSFHRYGDIHTTNGSGTDPTQSLQEIPLCSVSLGSLQVPWAGGAGLRLLPYRIFKKGLRRWVQSDTVVCYAHPWEFDQNQPRVSGLPADAYFRHYYGQRKMAEKFERLLVDFDWRPIQSVL